MCISSLKSVVMDYDDKATIAVIVGDFTDHAGHRCTDCVADTHGDVDAIMHSVELVPVAKLRADAMAGF